MVFSSPAFLFAFLPAVFLLYGLVPGQRPKNALLALFSFLFYALGEPVYVLLLAASVGINYLAGLLLGCRNPLPSKAVLAAAVVVNLGLLGLFKYAAFGVETLNRVAGLSLPLPAIVLPVGISFFTFQGLSYVVDCYRDPALASRSFLKLALYVAFFPQLIAGPIVKYHDVSQQIDQRRTSPELAARGIRRFIAGLSKKLLAANTLGHMADLVFAAAGSPSLDLRSAWLGALCYMLQIYLDFSGYSDMAIGLGHMFGFRFQENFRHPYASASMKEFWRRWHISLSTWFRDYLYIPLGGSRRGRLRTRLNKSLVFLCTGLWHGASWNFVLWGLWHGAFILLEDLLPPPGRLRRTLWRPLVLLTLLLSFVLFRADTLAQAGALYRGMVSFAFTPQGDALVWDLLSPLNLLVLCAGCLLSLPLLPWLQARTQALAQKDGSRLQGLPLVLRGASYAGSGLLFLLCVLHLAGAEFDPFIYFRF